jgi:hypothetical protein
VTTNSVNKLDDEVSAVAVRVKQFDDDVQAANRQTAGLMKLLGKLEERGFHVTGVEELTDDSRTAGYLLLERRPR